MASTYTSKYIIPGRRAGPIKKIINYASCNITSNIVSNTSTPLVPFKITSGSPTVEYSNGYYTITFLDNGGITFLVPLTSGDDDFNALVVGGGGGGGSGGLPGTGFYRGTIGGGGAAGGQVIQNSISVGQYFNYNVTVGQGGPSSTNGSPSSFSTINASGGNFGNDATSTQPGQGGFGVSPQDNDGGTGGYSVEEGSEYRDHDPTNGHNGIPITINSTTTRYAGGGGGGAYSNGTTSFYSAGGSGGGGNGSSPNAGAPNTGGGGGGNGDPVSPSPGGQGGSGIVIINFKYTPTSSTTTTTTTTTSTDCKVCICPSPINSKIVKNSNPDVIPGSTQRERIVNAIRYSRGGKVVYGNAAYQSSGNTLLGRLEGQPLSPFLSRNRF